MTGHDDLHEPDSAEAGESAHDNPETPPGGPADLAGYPEYLAGTSAGQEDPGTAPRPGPAPSAGQAGIETWEPVAGSAREAPTGSPWPPGAGVAWGPPPVLPPSAVGRGSSRWRRSSAVMLIAALVAAGVTGAGIALAVTGGTTTTALPKLGSPPPLATSNAKLNVAAIASRVDPAVIDISASSSDVQAAGTGMVLTSSGLALTNNHVVDGANQIYAEMPGSKHRYSVTVVGVDPTADVALIQLQGASGLPTVSPGDSSKLQVGDQVVAIGNALDLPGPPTVTSGVVSALDRSITVGDGFGGSEHLTGLIQTDAPISSGDSGGPLVDAAGQVIGMDTAAASAGNFDQAASNIGFAIPIDTALSIAQQIESGHADTSVQVGQPGIMGVEVANASDLGRGAFGGFGGFGNYQPPVSSGAVVVGVQPGSPAAGAGIEPGDVITSLDATTITSSNALSSAIANKHPGDSVRVGWVSQDSQHHTAALRLIAGPVK